MKNAANEYIPAQEQGNENNEDDINGTTFSNDGNW